MRVLFSTVPCYRCPVCNSLTTAVPIVICTEDDKGHRSRHVPDPSAESLAERNQSCGGPSAALRTERACAPPGRRVNGRTHTAAADLMGARGAVVAGRTHLNPMVGKDDMMNAQPTPIVSLTAAAQPLMYTVKEIAALLGIGKTKAHELVNTPPEHGGIPAMRIGPKTIRVRRVDFERWLDEQREAA